MCTTMYTIYRKRNINVHSQRLYAEEVVGVRRGTGGLIISKEIRGLFGPREVEITLIDQRERTEFRPSYLYVAFGYRKPEQISAPWSM